MSDFPTLKTGAIMQYPAEKAIQFSTQVLRFVDGTEQRFPRYGTPAHRWVIRLDLLDEQEIGALSDFFVVQSGAAGDFSFTDPWTNTVYSTCSFESDALQAGFSGDGRIKTNLVVRENRD